MRPRHGPRRRGDPSGGFRASPRGGRPSRAPPPRKSGYSLRILLGRGLASRSSRPAPSSPLPKGPVLAAPVSLSRCPPCPPPPLPHPAARAASAPGRACLGRVALAPELGVRALGANSAHPPHPAHSRHTSGRHHSPCLGRAVVALAALLPGR